MSEINAEIQKLAPTAIISLFTLDTTKIGGPLLRFVMSSKSDGPVSFQGLLYEPVDVEFDGLETTGIGALPTPSLKLKHTSGIIEALVNTYEDLNGCELSRIRTFARFLDNEPDSDHSAYFGPDRYRIERKVDDNPDDIQWELSTSMDQENTMIPGRVIIANTCMWKYRVFDQTLNGGSGGFDYSKALCPYTGPNSYDINDAPTTDDKDVPSRGIECCKTRFGADQPFPFGAFPGVKIV